MLVSIGLGSNPCLVPYQITHRRIEMNEPEYLQSIFLVIEERLYCTSKMLRLYLVADIELSKGCKGSD
jgi:hypothetical protein